MRAPWLVILLLVGCKPREEDKQKAAAAKQEEWERSVAADKAKRVVLTDPGQEPRRLLGERDLAVGKTLVASIDIASTTTIARAGDEPFIRPSIAHIVLAIRMREPAEDRFPGTFEVTALEGDLKGKESLPRKGSFETGAFGEPWATLVDDSYGSRPTCCGDAI